MAGFVALSSLILVMGSERAYWTLGGLSLDTLVVVPLFYMIPAGVLLWLMTHARVADPAQMVLAGAVYAFVVEGVLTPVVYSDGPWPTLALMFVGWHGLIATVGFWYLIRRWLVEGDLRRLGIAAGGFGVFWGIWSVTWTLPDSFGTDPAELAEFSHWVGPLDPNGYAAYVFGVGLILAAAHWLIGFVWPIGIRLGRRTTVTVLAVAGLYHVVTVLPAVPWAPLKLAALTLPMWWLLRRPSSRSAPTLITRLGGRVPGRHAALILVMPATAAVTYRLVWPLAGAPDTVQAIFNLQVSVQVIAGAAALIWATRREMRLQVGPEDGGGGCTAGRGGHL